jgi:aspartyl-tRNA synthetase
MLLIFNYQLLQDSITYYDTQGFTRIETPWIVSAASNMITRPREGTTLMVTPSKVDSRIGKERDGVSWGALVASGEQSFLQLYMDETLPKGQFQTTTACFRDELVDYTHSRWFMKNELIKTDIVSQAELEIMVEKAYCFFKSYVENIKITKEPHGYDIIGNGLELGSYGIRTSDVTDWIYGTGCAEPRLSKAIKLNEDKQYF